MLSPNLQNGGLKLFPAHLGHEIRGRKWDGQNLNDCS